MSNTRGSRVRSSSRVKGASLVDRVPNAVAAKSCSSMTQSLSSSEESASTSTCSTRRSVLWDPWRASSSFNVGSCTAMLARMSRTRRTSWVRGSFETPEEIEQGIQRRTASSTSGRTRAATPGPPAIKNCRRALARPWVDRHASCSTDVTSPANMSSKIERCSSVVADGELSLLQQLKQCLMERSRRTPSPSPFVSSPWSRSRRESVSRTDHGESESTATAAIL